MDERHEKRIENNLTNITNEDFVYKVTVQSLRENLSEDARVLFDSTPHIPLIVGDSYFIHYSVTPTLREENEDPIMQKALEFDREYITSDECIELRTITMLDDELSMIYGIKFAEEIIAELRQRLEQQIQQQNQNGQCQYNNLQSLLNDAKSGNQNAQQMLSQMCQQVLQQMLDDQNGNGQCVLHQIMQNATKNAKDFTQKAKDIRDLMGGKEAGKEAGSFQKTLDLTKKIMAVREYDQVISFAKKITDSMPRFATIIKERDIMGDEVGGYYLTKKLERAIPRELALPEDLLMYKLASGGFLAKEKLATKEGAYYVIIDKSGSMAGDKTVWARSVALALYRLAKMRKRKYFLRFFDTVVYPNDKPIEKPDEIIDHILTIGSDGGTDIDNAIATALRDLKEHGLSEFTNTIILITDGEDDVKDWTDELKKHNTKLISIMIQGDNNSLRKASTIYLRAKLDKDGALRLLKIAGR